MPSTLPDLIQDAGKVESRITPEAVQRRVRHHRRARGGLAVLVATLALLVTAPLVVDGGDNTVSVAAGREDAGPTEVLAAAPPALQTVTLRPASPEEAVAMGTGRYAYLKGKALVIADARGQIQWSIDLPQPIPGFSQTLVGVTERALVSNGNVALIVDLRSSEVRSVGISGPGMVLDPGGSGFWAGQGSNYTLRDWEGRPVGEAVTLYGKAVPFGTQENTLVALVMNDGTVVSADKTGVAIVGSGMPLAADRSNISFRTDEGDLTVVAGGSARTVASMGSLRPAQTFGAASFSPDGQWLGVAVKSQNSEIDRGGTTGVVLVDLRLGRPPLFIRTPLAHGLDWRDDGRILLTATMSSVMVLDPDTHVLLELPGLPPEARIRPIP